MIVYVKLQFETYDLSNFFYIFLAKLSVINKLEQKLINLTMQPRLVDFGLKSNNGNANYNVVEVF